MSPVSQWLTSVTALTAIAQGVRIPVSRKVKSPNLWLSQLIGDIVSKQHGTPVTLKGTYTEIHELSTALDIFDDRYQKWEIEALASISGKSIKSITVHKHYAQFDLGVDGNLTFTSRKMTHNHPQNPRTWKRDY